MAELPAVFAEFERDFARTGARWPGHATAALHAEEVRKLGCAGLSKSAIVRHLDIGRTSMRRILKERIRSLQEARPQRRFPMTLRSWCSNGKGTSRR
jgi:hypothetical protein